MQNQTVMKVGASAGGPFWLSAVNVLDIEQLVDEFFREIHRDVDQALMFWKSTLALIPAELHSMLSRLVEGKISLLTRRILSNSPEGQILLFNYMVEKARRPIMPTQPFFSAGIAYLYFAGLVARYAAFSAKEALQR